MNIFLAEITAWTGSAETTLRYSSGLGYTNGADWYAPRIENPATYAVSIHGAGYAAGSYGELTLINNDGALDSLADYAVDGRFLTLKYGDDAGAYSAFTTVLVAMMEGLSLERERVSIRLRDPARLLDKPITTRVYGGAGGLDGDAGLKGTPKPVLVGEATVYKPTLIDAARLIYQVHDGYVAAIPQVLTQTAQPITHGGDFASEAALLDSGTNLLPTGWGDFEVGDNLPTANSAPVDIGNCLQPSGRAAYIGNNSGSLQIPSIALTPLSTYNITGLTAGQSYRLTAKISTYTNGNPVEFYFAIWTATKPLSGLGYFNATRMFTAPYGSQQQFSDVISLAGDSNTAMAVGIVALLDNGEDISIDKFTVALDPVVTAGTFKTWRDTAGSYLRLGSDPQGPIHVSVQEYENGGSIGLLPDHALYRLATLWGHVINPTLTASGTAQTVAADGTTITLAAGASETDDAYNAKLIRVTSDEQVQVRQIVDYVGSTKVATLDAALQAMTDTTPDYEIAASVLGDSNEMQAVSAAYRDLIATETGTAQGGGTGNNQIQLATAASSTDDIYNGLTIIILSGTGAGQERTVSDYLGSTRTATVSANWTVNPNNTSVYEINESAAARLRNASVGYFSANSANLKQAMDAIAASVHAWYGFDALGLLRMGLYRDPGTETSIATLTEDHFISLERVTDANIETGLPNWRVTVISSKRWDPLSDNDAIPAGLSFVKEPWRNTRKQTDAATRKAHKLSAERSFESLMIDADGRRAEAMAADLLDLYKARHDTLTATIADPDLALTAIDIGQVVTVQVDRWGYTSGRKCRVVSLRRDYQRGIVDLTLWSASL